VVTLASLAVIYPLVQGREQGWPAWCFALVVAGVAGFAAFLAYERRHRERALIAPSLLANRAYTSGLVVAVCFFAAMIGLNRVLAVFCQVGEGFSPLRTGLTLAPFALGVAFTAPASYPLAQRFGRSSLQAGFAVMAGGFVLLAVMVHAAGEGLSSWPLVPGELVAGLGMGLALPPLFDFVLFGVQAGEVGSASGVLNAIQQLGAALGLAVLGTIFFAYLDHHRLPTQAMSSTTLLCIAPLALAFAASWLLPRRARELGAH
jgi:hypothetical protein